MVEIRAVFRGFDLANSACSASQFRWMKGHVVSVAGPTAAEVVKSDRLVAARRPQSDSAKTPYSINLFVT